MKNNIIEDNKFLSEFRFSSLYPQLYNEILEYTSFLNQINPSFSERKYCYINRIDKFLYCPICGNRLKYKDSYTGYQKTCSKKCSRSLQLQSITNDKKKEISEKISISIKNTISSYSDNKKKEISEKIKLSHKNMSVVEKNIRSSKISYSSKLERVNRSASKWRESIEKRRETFNLKSIDELNDIYNRISKSVKDTMNIKSSQEWDRIIEKQYNTKKENNSFNISRPENRVFEKLISKFPNTIRQYKTDEYPFMCDFYIPELDLYIEVNFHWTHGLKQFNENNNRCIKTLNKWVEKSAKSKFYQNAIYVWTKLDPLKRKTAKENNLNWIEFFNIDEFNKWFESIKKEC